MGNGRDWIDFETLELRRDPAPPIRVTILLMSRLTPNTLLTCAIVVALLAIPVVALAQADSVFDLLSRINALRRQNGLAPLELNDPLSAAAQRHSQDMANTGSVNHIGSDGTSPEQRMNEAGYAPHVSWGENIYGGGISTVDAAWGFWTASTVHRNNLLSVRYREIGIGVATSLNGTYYTLKFGARPGVLPFFVDQGSLLSDPNVTLTLSDEESASDGFDGALGPAVEVRIGEGEDLSGAAWQTWQRSIPFKLSSDAGEHRISIEYRDARGTLASYFRLVTLAGAQSDVTAVPTVLPTILPTITPTLTPTVQPTPTSTPPPTSTSTPAPTDIPAPTMTQTLDLSPTATQTPESSPTFAASPTTAPVLVTEVTPIARVSPEPASTVMLEVAAVPNRSVPSSAAPVISPPESAEQSLLHALVTRGWVDAPADWLGVLAGLQIAALVIGAVAITRRSIKSRGTRDISLSSAPETGGDEPIEDVDSRDEDATTA
jgi:hypothetical protein